MLEDDARGEKHRVVLDRRCFTGLQDLSASDAFKVFSEGEALVAHFHAPRDAYVALVGPTGPVLLTLKKLVVRREEARPCGTGSEGLPTTRARRSPTSSARCWMNG